MPDICEEMQRIVIRARFVKWAVRNWKPGDFKALSGRMMKLSARLTRAKPTWIERNPVDEEDDG